MKKALALLLLSGALFSLFAASATEAVGPGQAREPWDGVRGGMAGAGEALVDRMTASPVAAARGAFNDKTAFLLSASYEEAAAERHGAREALDGFDLGLVGFSVPVGFLGHVGLFYWPRSTRNLDFEEGGSSWSVKGGIQELTAAWSFRVPWVPRLALGLAWRQDLGAETMEMEIPLDPTAEDPVDASSSLDYTHKIRTSGGRPGASLFWMGRLLSLSAWWSSSYEVKRKLERTAIVQENLGVFGYSAPMFSSDRPKEVKSSSESWNQKMPWSAGAALSLRLTRTQSLNLDFHQDSWGTVSGGWIEPATPYSARTSAELETARRFSLGWSYEGSGRTYESFWRQSRYRAGVRWADLAAPGTQEIAGAFGCGFPLGRRGALVDLAFEGGLRYGDDSPDETFLGIRFGMTGVGNWGQKSRRR